MAFDGKHYLTNLYENSLRADKKKEVCRGLNSKDSDCEKPDWE